MTYKMYNTYIVTIISSEIPPLTLKTRTSAYDQLLAAAKAGAKWSQKFTSKEIGSVIVQEESNQNLVIDL